jgi:prepilin-type N-terminal cleavage/methylation domain-containing protein
MKMQSKKGFTLLELLVVIGIIGLLASMVLASLDGTKKRGRDARRISDIKQIQLALELYYDTNNVFPSNNTSTTFDPTLLTGPGFIPVVPTDPLTNTAYRYTAYAAAGGNSGTCISYHLGATLESANHTELARDVDISTANSTKPPTSTYVICSAGSPPSTEYDGLATGANCGGTMGTASPGGTEMCYDVRP